MVNHIILPTQKARVKAVAPYIEGEKKRIDTGSPHTHKLLQEAKRWLKSIIYRVFSCWFDGVAT